jgi:hypothetical protein
MVSPSYDVVKRLIIMVAKSTGLTLKGQEWLLQEWYAYERRSYS